MKPRELVTARGALAAGAALIFCGLWLLAGCAHAPSAAAKTESYAARGVVREVALDGRSAVIRHEEVPGYMPPMTMEFRVLEPAGLQGIAAGDAVTFRLVVTKDSHWIEDVRREGESYEWSPQPFRTENAPFSPALERGSMMPDHAFRAENGREMRLSDFRGKTVAFTFIFTRCPLPDYCPRMSRSFEQARRALRAAGAGHWQFLSLSFDPEYDTPQILKRHARAYREGDDEGWLFGAVSSSALPALSAQLELNVRKDSGSFSHNLRTVVLDPAGRIHQQFIGNAWTGKELADSMLEAARQSAKPPSGVPR